MRKRTSFDRYYYSFGLFIIIISEAASPMDFCEIFPPELTNKLFSYVSDQDIYSCACCSLLWRETINNNPQWRLRCSQRGWCSSASNGDTDILQHWTDRKSHVAPNEAYRFRTSPVFSPLPLGDSQNLSPMCEWAIYYRKRSHLTKNWHMGIYKITKLQFPGVGGEHLFHLINNAHCDGTLLAAGTHRGYVLLWKVEGVPEFITSIPPHHNRLVVDAVKLVASKYLVVLYQIGVLIVFTITKDETGKYFIVKPFYEVRGVKANLSFEDGYDFECQLEYLPPDDPIRISNDNLAELVGEENELQRSFQPHLRRAHGDLEAIDILLFSSESHIILTGRGCNCFTVWDILAVSPKKISLQPKGYCVEEKCHISARKIYFPLYLIHPFGGREEFCISIYDLKSLAHVTKAVPEIIIPCTSEVEEIYADSEDRRIVYSTEDNRVCGISGMDIITKEILFYNEIPHSIDYITVSDEIIVYQDSNGMHVGLNWSGDPLYVMEGDIGRVLGLRTVPGNILVSGGTSRQLSVWNLKSGEKLHTVYHQPSLIHYLYADETKIVTIGQEDEPVVVGYW